MRRTDEREAWRPISWFCPVCGNVVTGYQNKNGVIKAECPRCRSVTVRTHMGKRSDTIRLFPAEADLPEAFEAD